MPLKFSTNKKDLVLSISLILVFVLMTIMSFWFGISGDEPDMNNYGKAILRYFSSFGSDQFVFSGDPSFDRDGVIKYYGGLFDLVAAIINKISPFAEYTTRHILNAWMGFVAIFFAAKITHYITDKIGATIVVWLIFLSPFFLGHSMNNPKDIPFAATYIMSIWLIIRLFNKLPNPKWQDYLFVVLSIGATINIRVGGILLIPYLGVFTGILLIHKKLILKESFTLKQYFKPIIITALGGYLAGSLLWPYALQNPISNPLNALSELSNFKINLAQLWNGHKIMSSELPKSYLIQSFGYTNTIAVLIGLALGIILAFKNAKRKTFAVTAMVVFTGFFPLFYIIVSGSNVYHAWRHVLFIYPSLAILAAYGWFHLNKILSTKIKMAALALLALLLLEPLYFIGKTFPNTNTYYNFLVGGVDGAYTNYEVDYYYNSLKECADWFEENELPKFTKDSVALSTNAIHILPNYLNEGKIKWDYLRYNERNNKNWDYMIMHIALIPQNDLITKNWLPASTVYTAKVNDNVLCAVVKRPSYEDIKGFDNLANGDIEAAITSFKKYIEADKTNTNMLNYLAKIYIQKNDFFNAGNYTNQSYAIDNTNPSTTMLLYFLQAVDQQKKQQYNQAIQSYNAATQDPFLRNLSLKAMGDIYMAQGQTDQANKLYQALNSQ